MLELKWDVWVKCGVMRSEGIFTVGKCHYNCCTIEGLNLGQFVMTLSAWCVAGNINERGLHGNEKTKFY